MNCLSSLQFAGDPKVFPALIGGADAHFSAIQQQLSNCYPRTSHNMVALGLLIRNAGWGPPEGGVGEVGGAGVNVNACRHNNVCAA